MVRSHLDHAAEGGYKHLLSGINYGEVNYNILRRKGEEASKTIRAKIAELPIEVIMPGFETMISASLLKAAGGLSYADCFASALALEHGIPVLTGDSEFKSVIPRGVKVEWLPSNR